MLWNQGVVVLNEHRTLSDYVQVDLDPHMHYTYSTYHLPGLLLQGEGGGGVSPLHDFSPPKSSLPPLN